jgi:hypothetical protein
VCLELTGDAELKMDWTEPPTELDAMGFYSGCLVFGGDQIAAWTDRWEMLASVHCGEVVHLEFIGEGEGDQMRPSARCQAAWCLGTLRSEFLWG